MCTQGNAVLLHILCGAIALALTVSRTTLKCAVVPSLRVQGLADRNFVVHTLVIGSKHHEGKHIFAITLMATIMGIIKVSGSLTPEKV